MLLTDKTIAIIGGGPGGLTLARLLQLNGVKVKVYERDINSAARVQGATLDLHQESGLRTIRAAGLYEAFRSTYRPGAEKGRVIDKHGRIIHDEHSMAATEDPDSEHSRPEIDRGPLRDLLLASLQQDTVVWNSQFSTMSHEQQGWRLQFKNGTTAYADLVIGADGANSKVRPFVTDVQPFYAGTVIIQGNVPDAALTVPAIHELLQNGKIYVFADERFLHVSSKGDGSIDFYMSSKKDENWWQNSGVDFSDRSQISDWFRAEFPGWDPVWLTLIGHTDLPLLLRPQYCMPLSERWKTSGNVTLLGDAAHIMPPSGEGVNLAMLDALELSKTLTDGSHEDLQTAIAAYEDTIRNRAAEESVVSMEMTEQMHAVNAQSWFVENFCAVY